MLVVLRSANLRMKWFEHDLDGDSVLLLLLLLLLLLPLSPSVFPSLPPSGFFDPASFGDLFGNLPGCSPGIAASSRDAHVWSVVNTDPPKSFRHLVTHLFDTWLSSCTERGPSPRSRAPPGPRLSKVHPATKQLDGRKQPQTRPVFMASSHTTKTSAMPSNLTLHYAAKQLDDTVINKRTQPFTQQLNTSPPAKQLDGSTWFKSWQLEPKTRQQSLLHSSCSVPTHAGRHDRNCSRLPTSRTVPGQTSRTLKMSAHDTSCTRHSPQTHERDRSLTLHFATRITRRILLPNLTTSTIR